MRLLALSDIHGQVDAVQRLRTQESNRFDAVVVAGDIGGDTADQVFGILATFGCPVLYVYGNHDHTLAYDRRFPGQAHHLHLQAVTIGDFVFIGYSGLPAHWGLNPIASQLQEDASSEALTLNRRALADLVRRIGPARCIVVTHDRQPNSGRDMAGVPLFLFGHRHGYRHTASRGSHFINVSVLDAFITMRPDALENPTLRDMRNVDMGTYAVIEIDRTGHIEAQSRRFMAIPEGWSPVPSFQLRTLQRYSPLRTFLPARQ